MTIETKSNEFRLKCYLCGAESDSSPSKFDLWIKTSKLGWSGTPRYESDDANLWFDICPKCKLPEQP